MVDLGQKGVRSRERLFKNSHTQKNRLHTQPVFDFYKTKYYLASAYLLETSSQLITLKKASI
jgi:hypothetical protein